MKLDNNILMEMARSIGFAQPENEDSVIIVPNDLVASIRPRKPMDVQLPQASTPTRGSSWNKVGFLRTATGGSSVDVLSLSPGLWEISGGIAAGFNYFEGSANATVSLELQPFSSSIVLASAVAAGTSTQLCTVSDRNTMVILLPGAANPIRAVFQTNIAAQTMVGHVYVVAHAILVG